MGKGQGSGADSDEKSFVALICAFFFPPIAVAYVDGCGCSLLINIALCCMFWVPAIIHAFWIVLKKNDDAS